MMVEVWIEGAETGSSHKVNEEVKGVKKILRQGGRMDTPILKHGCAPELAQFC